MKKILIIKLSAMGDVFIALRHVEAIISHYREDQIWMLTSPTFREIFSNHPRLKVIILDRKKMFGNTSPWGQASWIRKQQFDMIFDLQIIRTCFEMGCGLNIQ